MIKKSISAAILIFLFYTIFVFYSPTWWRASQHQWQSNVINAQKFLYDESDTIQSVIIGSSLSCNLNTAALSKTYNLSFRGLSIFDGLKIIAQKPKLPKNIFIEMNYILRHESQGFTATLTSPILYYPRKIVLSLREDKQPIGIIGKIGNIIITEIKPKFSFSQRNQKKDTIDIRSNKDNELFLKMLNIQISEYSHKPEQVELDQSFNKLSEYILKFENMGVNIVFFEMPVDNKLTNLPMSKSIREEFFKHFPTSKYNYISLPDSSDCTTSDGIHLVRDAAIKYTIYFKSEGQRYHQ
ncbi:MAG: hypothetical protein WCP85_19820 [Mariniphaga sp.]